jgi:hypothetical protein
MLGENRKFYFQDKKTPEANHLVFEGVLTKDKT